MLGHIALDSIPQFTSSSFIRTSVPQTLPDSPYNQSSPSCSQSPLHNLLRPLHDVAITLLQPHHRPSADHLGDGWPDPPWLSPSPSASHTSSPPAPCPSRQEQASFDSTAIILHPDLPPRPPASCTPYRQQAEQRSTISLVAELRRLDFTLRLRSQHMRVPAFIEYQTIMSCSNRNSMAVSLSSPSPSLSSAVCALSNSSHGGPQTAGGEIKSSSDPQA